jgi:energy-coupling factor transporter transmembrane protein EcfT
MLSLLIRFIPMILNQAIETAQAQRSRGIELRKNPVSRLVRFSIALMRRIFLDADRLVTAMRARSYSENRTPPEFSAEISDWVILSGVLVFCVTAWML